MKDSPSKKRLLILDRDLLTCQALTRALGSHQDFEVLDTALGPEEVREKVRRQPVEFILASSHFPSEDVLALGRWIREDGHDPAPRLIVTGIEDDEQVILRYLESGVSGYTLGEFSMEGLAMVIRLLDRKEAVLSPRLAYLLIHRVSELAEVARGRGLKPSNLEELTRREREVLEEVAKGLTNREVADRLYVSVGTVKSHVHKILKKLEVRSREEAARILKLWKADRGEERDGPAPVGAEGPGKRRGARS